MRTLLWILGVMGLGNGAWMLANPEGWYLNLPARIPDTGPLNVHFVRDIGCIYAAAGVALCVAAEVPRARWGLLIAVALFYGFHALLHVADIVSGALPSDHVLIDLPGVFAPAVLLFVLALPRHHREAGAR
jgi:predicted anti-sigma-YlaC factor YlaD